MPKKKDTMKGKKAKTKAVKTKKAMAKKKETKKVKTKKARTKKAAPLTQRNLKIQEIKKKLITHKESLLAEAEDALNELPEQTVFPDLGDQASAETERSFMLRLRGRERRLLKKIDDAIDRIDRGVYGICDKCGNEIDVRRLEARPVTALCIECKKEQEQEEKLKEK